ncbi:hypothetical protein GCM10027567_05560 [Spongiibacter taiwanensis]
MQAIPFTIGQAGIKHQAQARLQAHRVLGKLTQADFRALEVTQQANVLILLAGDFPNQRRPSTVLLCGAVRKIQSKDIHTCFDHGSQ